MQSIVILIDDPSKINEIIKYAEGDNTKIFSLNYDTHKALEKLRIKHEIGESYLDFKELDDLDKYLIDLTLNWHQDPEIRDYLLYDSLNLAQLLEMEIVQYFIPFLLSAKSSLKILDIEKPSSVIAATKINKFLEHYCYNANVKITSISISEVTALPLDNFLLKLNLGGIPISVKISRKKFLSVKGSFEKFLYTLFNLYDKNNKSNQKSVMLFDFNTANYTNLLNELSKINNKILLLNTRRPAIWNLHSLRIILKTGCKIVNLQRHEDEIKHKFDLQEKEFFINLNKLWNKTELLERLFSIDSTPFWQSIKTSFISVLDARFRESIMRILLFKSLLEQSNISIILEWAETAQEERELIHVAKQHNIKILFLQHALAAISEPHIKFGMFLTHLAHPLLSDTQAVWGGSAKDYALSKKNNKNIEVTGSPRHDKYFKIIQDASSKPMILFAPTGPSGISCKYSTTDKIIKFYDFVRKTCKVAQNIQKRELIVKPHPSTAFSNDVVEIVRQIDNKIKITFTFDVLSLIKDCELLITTNNSTIAIDAIMLGKPVICLQSEDWSLDEALAKSGAVLSVTNPKDIEDSIKKILNDVDFKNSLLEKGKIFLNTHFANQGTASKALAQTVQRISD